MAKLYVASSWRNPSQPFVVELFRLHGYEVYDFRHPDSGEDGFHWSDIDPNWGKWKPEAFIKALDDPLSNRGFANDFDGMSSSDACVLLLPCGRSAHLEAGWFVGMCRPLVILIPDATEPELMYKMATGVTSDMKGAIQILVGAGIVANSTNKKEE